MAATIGAFAAVAIIPTSAFAQCPSGESLVNGYCEPTSATGSTSETKDGIQVNETGALDLTSGGPGTADLTTHTSTDVNGGQLGPPPGTSINTTPGTASDTRAVTGHAAAKKVAKVPDVTITGAKNITLKGGKLLFTLKKRTKSLTIKIKSLHISHSLRTRLKAGKVKFLTFTTVLKAVNGKKVTIKLKLFLK